MRITGALLAILTLVAANALAATPVPFTASYSTQYGMLSATGTRTLEKRSDGNWAFENRASALFAEITENSTFALRDGHITPLNYNFRNPLSAKRNLSLVFNWQQGKAEDHERNISVPLQGAVYDKLSYQLQLQRDVCANPEKFGTLNYTVIDGKKLKTYRVEFIDKQLLDTQVGKLATVHLRQYRPDKNPRKYTLFWLASDYDCLLVRLDEQEGKDIVRLDLTGATVNGVGVKGK
jgi:hypothetical protein